MPVFEAGPYGWHEGFEELRFLQFTQEPERGATQKFIGVLKIFAVRVAHQYHFLKKLPVRSGLKVEKLVGIHKYLHFK